MTKLTRSQFVALLASGKYDKIEGDLSRGISTKSGKAEVCAIGAALKETGTENLDPAPGFNYLPPQLVKDLDITPEFERKIFRTNDQNEGDNWKAVIDMLRKEWNLPEYEEINLYEAEQLLEGYFTNYYDVELKPDNFGYNL